MFYNAGQSGKGIQVVIGKNATKIPAYLFYPTAASGRAPKITSVEFEEGSVCTSIGDRAFYGCESLKNVTISDSVTYIGEYVFYDCSKLTNITFKDTSTWYITTNYANWQNKMDGTQMIMTNSSTNANYFKDFLGNGYAYYYWYKK